ncbi:hypothetical protein MMC28_000744 [Mycoblastus sanguinarius]|nr:hypothetical protein [Mycoblastus sanguinarius]
MKALAENFELQGQYTQAEDLYLRALYRVLNVESAVPKGSRQKIEGDTMSQLGSMYFKQKRFDDAGHVQSLALPIFERLWGKHHRWTLNVMADLAMTYYCQGRYDEAEKLDLVVFEQRKQLEGESHWGTLDSMWNLSATWLEQGKAVESGLPLRERVKTNKAYHLALDTVNLTLRVFGDQHKDFLSRIERCRIEYGIELSAHRTAGSDSPELFYTKVPQNGSDMPSFVRHFTTGRDQSD